MSESQNGPLKMFFAHVDLGAFQFGDEERTHTMNRLPRQLENGGLFWSETIEGNTTLMCLTPKGEPEVAECKRLFAAAEQAAASLPTADSNLSTDEILAQLPVEAAAAIRQGDAVAAMKALIRNGGYRVQTANDLANALVEVMKNNQ